MDLSNSASSSGLSVSKSNGFCVSSQTCFSLSVRTITASLMRFGNQFGQLSLGFHNGQRFHDCNLSQFALLDKPKSSLEGRRAKVKAVFCFAG